MSEPVTIASGRSTQTLRQIELSPLRWELWEELLLKVRGQNDPLSIKSLEVIIDGLKKIDENAVRARARGETPVQLASFSQASFLRLAKAYNSPTLLKQVGIIYLRELHLPSVALQHFERSMRLGGPEKELRPLSEAAAVAVQKQLALESGQQAEHSGITSAQHAKPVATNIIRKTGRLLMPARIGQAAPTKVTSTIGGIEQDEPQPLPETTAECLAEAAQAIAKGQLLRAEALMQKADEQPGTALEMWQTWTNLGHAFYLAGLPPHVETSFFAALKYDPEELASRFNMALGYHLNDQYEKALIEYIHSNQIDPKHPKVWCNLGVLYFQMDQYPQAETSLVNATSINPDYARAWDNLAAAYGAQDKLIEALAACQRAVSLRPDYPEAYFKMGVIHFSQNDMAEAEAALSHAAQLPALTAYCHAFQAMIHARLEQTDAAEAAVQRAMKADPKCDLLWMAWNDLGLTFYAAGNFPRAAVAYEEATMIKPDEAEAWFNLGASYHQTGDLRGARDAYQHAVDLKESLSGAWHNLGIICTQSGDDDAATRAFQQEARWDPDNVRAWYDLGVSLEKVGRKDDAKVAFANVEMLEKVRAEMK